MLNLVGFSGFMHSGKSTASKFLRDNHGYTITSFAGPLKQAAAIAFGVDHALFLDENEKKAFCDDYFFHTFFSHACGAASLGSYLPSSGLVAASLRCLLHRQISSL